MAMKKSEAECWKDYLACKSNCSDAHQICLKECVALAELYGPGILEPCFNSCEAATMACSDECSDALAFCRGQDPREKQRFNPFQKNVLGTAAAAYIGVGTATIFFGGALLAFPPVSLGLLTFVGIVGTSAMIAGQVFSDLRNDPIDYNFKKFAQPKPPKMPFIRPEPGTPITEEVAAKMYAVLANQSKIIGTGRAIVTSINRAQGAAVSKKYSFEKQQMKNAGKNAEQLAKLLTQDASLRLQAASALRDNGAVFYTSEEDALKTRSAILKDGLPQELQDIIRRYSRSAKERNVILRQFRSGLSNIEALVIAFPEILTTEDLSIVEWQAASTLRKFAKSAIVPAY
jgi:hypothetical protein